MMKKILALIMDWIAARSVREKVLLGIAVTSALVWVGVVAAWQPLHQRQADLEGRIARYDRGIAALAAITPSTDSFREVTDDSRPIPLILTDLAALFQLTIRRLEDEQNGARVVLGEATFEQVILWMESLERDHGLRVIELEMARKPAPGVVSTTLVLER